MDRKNIHSNDQNYNRRYDIGQHSFKRVPFPFLYSWVLSNLPMDGQSLKVLNPSLFCEDFENRNEGFWKFWSALVLVPGRMSWWLQAKCPGSDLFIANMTALIRINPSFYFTFTKISHLYTSFRAGNALSLMVEDPLEYNTMSAQAPKASLKSL